MNIYTIANIIGILGVIIILVTYFLLQAGKLKSISFTYSILNALGSSMILFSLFYAWNLAAALVEIAWIIISLFGIYKRIMDHKKIIAVEEDAK